MRIFLSSFCLFCLSNFFAVPTNIQQNLDTLIDKTYPNATIAVVIKNPKRGKEQCLGQNR